MSTHRLGNGLGSFLSLLRQERHDVTIPLFDHSATIASRHKDLLSELTRVPVVDYDRFMLARDKHETMRKCAEAGVPHPATFDPEAEPMDRIARQVGFPCIVKPNISHGAIGIRRAADP